MLIQAPGQYGNRSAVCETTSTTDNLLFALRQRFSRVTYRRDGRYEIGNLIVLSEAEARTVIEKTATLEQVVMYRSYPHHLVPERIRTALCRTAPMV